ncbi:hypothetical protein [Sinomonas soli]
MTGQHQRETPLNAASKSPRGDRRLKQLVQHSRLTLVLAILTVVIPALGQGIYLWQVQEQIGLMQSSLALSAEQANTPPPQAAPAAQPQQPSANLNSDGSLTFQGQRWVAATPSPSPSRGGSADTGITMKAATGVGGDEYGPSQWGLWPILLVTAAWLIAAALLALELVGRFRELGPWRQPVDGPPGEG